jgi:hypothetical protein
MTTCICNSREVVTECDRCLNSLCKDCSKIILKKNDMEIIHNKCLRKKERLQ